jgi:hypothetical protein
MAFPFYILDIILVVMHAFVLFPHKKIKVKLKWAQYSFLIYVLSGLGLLIFMLTGSELALQGSAVSPKAGLFLFLAGIPLSYLAVKSVKKDKALVDSVDRIR